MVKNKIKEQLQKDTVQIITSSGTATTLGSLAIGQRVYHRNSVDGKDFSANRIGNIGKDILSRYLRSSRTNILSGCEKGFISRRFDHPCAKDNKQMLYYRMGLLASGTVIINSVLETIGDCTVRIADRGVREGVLYDLMDRIRNFQSVSWHRMETRGSDKTRIGAWF
jgi:exopolyphosphatase/guanosine-5'-triphosphate,3'-diphosphate pyrophosphatase